jgi:hypothetical protein
MALCMGRSFQVPRRRLFSRKRESRRIARFLKSEQFEFVEDSFHKMMDGGEDKIRP